MIIVKSLYTRYHNLDGHLENKSREEYILRGFEDTGAKIIDVEPASENKAKKVLCKIHSNPYIEKVFNVMKKSQENERTIWLDSDTYISPGTYYAVLADISIILKGLGHNPCFLLTRPPGHHAGKNGLANSSTLGFCLFNNAALLSRFLAEQGYKVCILDIDLHHGNGTEDIVKNTDIAYISIHGRGIYPGTGLLSYKNIFNFPLDPGTNNQEYLKAFYKVLNLIKKFDTVVVSLGFDAHREDPLSIFNIDFEVYETIFKKLRDFEVYFVLEGGYNPKVLYEGSKLLSTIF